MDFTTQLGVRWEIGSRWKHLRGSDRGDNTPNQLGSIAAASERLVRSGRIIRQIPSNCSIVTDITNALIGGSPLDQITVPVDEAIVCPIDDAAFDGALDGNTPNPLPGGLTP